MEMVTRNTHIRLWKWLIKTLPPIYGNGRIGHQPFMETESNCSGEDLA
jgi:hypothetical protein